MTLAAYAPFQQAQDRQAADLMEWLIALIQLATGPLCGPTGAASGQGDGRGRRSRGRQDRHPAAPRLPGRVLGRKVCFADCKGTDPTLVAGLIAAYRLGNPQARVGCWPDTAMDMWRGSPAQVPEPPYRGRAVHRAVLPAGRLGRLRLALTAPDMPPVEGSDELLRRLDVDELTALWEVRPPSSRTSRPSATTPGQRMGRRRERTGRLPTPTRRPWLPVPPLSGRGRR
jgi:hypothetical protein